MEIASYILQLLVIIAGPVVKWLAGSDATKQSFLSFVASVQADRARCANAKAAAKTQKEDIAQRLRELEKNAGK